MLSYLLDSDPLSLFAVITHLEKNSQPWENVAIAVYFVQKVNKDLPAHASYLTRIEALHYRTLNKNKSEVKKEKVLMLDHLFDDTNRVINLDAIPAEQSEAKNHFEKYYSQYPVSINQPGTFLHIKDDGIYTYMYEIGDDIQFSKDGLKTIKGNFAGFRNSDIGLTLHPALRRFLEIEPGSEINFTVTIGTRLFVKS